MSELFCFSCGREEEARWRRCFECGHQWGRRELVELWRRGMLSVLRPSSPWVFSTRFRESVTRSLWRALTVRAKNVTFCPKCLHDF